MKFLLQFMFLLLQKIYNTIDENKLGVLFQNIFLNYDINKICKQ
jgi:hypothetical protein